MRYSSVRDGWAVLDHFGVDYRSPGAAIDVGGTDTVWLRRDARRDAAIERNPLLEAVPGLRLLDRGFNEDSIGSTVDDRVDFLDPAVAARLENRFDLVFCFDTLEHVSNPFLFCEHLARIAKPGGFVYVSTLFRFVYHPSPEDYFRFSPVGLRQCFEDPANGARDEGSVVWSGWESDDHGVALLYQKGVQRTLDTRFALAKQEKPLTVRLLERLNRRFGSGV